MSRTDELLERLREGSDRTLARWDREEERKKRKRDQNADAKRQKQPGAQ